MFLLILAWLVVTALVGVAVETLLQRERLREEGLYRLAEPRCGRCGYIVIGLPGHVCPECGSDLRVVGVD